MQAWQWAVIGAVALVCVGYMSVTIVRMFSGVPDDCAIEREATAAESGIYGAEAPEGTRVFDGYSYRTPARFAGRIRVLVSEDKVVVAGARAPMPVYQLWIWLQGLTLALVPVGLAAAAVRLDWRWLLAALGMLLLSSAFMAIGAGSLPGLGEPQGMSTGRQTAVEIERDAIRDVTDGLGWSRDGIALVTLPYKAGIDQVTKANGVSFRAPDGHGRTVNYAVHLPEVADTEDLKALLGGASAGAAGTYSP